MSMKHVVGTCAMGLMLSMASLGASGSDVADAAMAGDTAAVRALLAQHANVNAVQADGAALGGVPRGLGHGEPADSRWCVMEGGEPRGSDAARAGLHQRERGHG